MNKRIKKKLINRDGYKHYRDYYDQVRFMNLCNRAIGSEISASSLTFIGKNNGARALIYKI